MKKYIICGFLLFLILGCKKEEKMEQAIIARIGDRKITVEEFRAFYNFDVNFGLDSTGMNALKDELLFFIDQVIALKYAEEDGLTQDVVFRRAYEWEKRQAMLRQLYRDKVQAQIRISDEELKNLYVQQQTQVHLRHLFFDNIEEAEEAYQFLMKGVPFEKLAKETFQDTLLANSGGDLGWVTVSELEKEFSQSLNMLPIKNVSKPVKSKWGYHIVQILDKKEPLILSDSKYQNALPSLKKKIRSDKSKKYSSDYIKQYIGRLNPQLNPEMFRKFWVTIVPDIENEQTQLSNKIFLSDYHSEKVKKHLKNDLTEPIIIHRQGSISLGRFLEGVEAMPINHRFSFKSQRELSDQIGKWIRDDFLLKEAYLLNIDDHKRVKDETNRFMEEQSYYYYHGLTMDTLDVPLAVENFYNNKNKKLKNNSGFEKYHTLQGWKFEKAKRQLYKFFNKKNVFLFIDHKILEEENKKINWDNKIRMFMIRKPS